VEDPEVDAPMTRRPPALAVLVLLAVLAAGALSPAALAAAPGASSGPPVTGGVSGPGLVATSSNATFYLNASGGPAEVGGALTGTINWSASLAGPNTTGMTVTPSSGSIANSTHQPVKMVVYATAYVETAKLVVEVKSVNGKTNATANFTTTFRVVQPYVVRATIVAGPGPAVLPFNISVQLDGRTVGTVAVPKLAPNSTFSLVYRYPTAGLPSGYHTFTLSLADAHGLVTFPNGLTVQATTFYVAPAPANNTLWYVTGVVAFFGVLFIYATRVAARRRGTARR
jgi:hypothetical protein